MSRVACLNFKKSRVAALSMFHIAVTVAVRNLNERMLFVAISL